MSAYAYVHGHTDSPSPTQTILKFSFVVEFLKTNTRTLYIWQNILPMMQGFYCSIHNSEFIKTGENYGNERLVILNTIIMLQNLQS